MSPALSSGIACLGCILGTNHTHQGLDSSVCATEVTLDCEDLRQVVVIRALHVGSMVPSSDLPW